MGKEKIQQFSFGSDRQTIKNASVKFREGILNPDYKELLVKFSGTVGWIEFPSEERLYTGVNTTLFPRTTDTTNIESGAELIGVKHDEFKHIIGDRNVQKTFKTVDDAFDKTIQKDGSNNMEGEFTFEKPVTVADATGKRQLGNAALNVAGNAVVARSTRELIINGGFFKGDFSSFGWEVDDLEIKDDGTQGWVETTQAIGSGFFIQYLTLRKGTYILRYTVLENTDDGSNDLKLSIDINVDGSEQELASTVLLDENDDPTYREVIIDTTSDLDAIRFNIGVDPANDFIFRLTDISLKEYDEQLLIDGEFEDLPSIWEIRAATTEDAPTDDGENGNEVTFKYVEDDDNNVVQFLPTGTTDDPNYLRYLDSIIEKNTWYELTYDVTKNTDINNSISAYVQTTDSLNNGALLDLSVDTNKKIIFKSARKALTHGVAGISKVSYADVDGVFVLTLGITTSNDNFYFEGMSVNISDSGLEGVDGDHLITSVTDADTFQIEIKNADDVGGGTLSNSGLITAERLDFKIKFLCDSASPVGLVHLDNLSLVKISRGDLSLAGDLNLNGSVNNANIQGFLNLKQSAVFINNTFDLSELQNESIKNSVYLLCDGSSDTEANIVLKLPSVTDENMDGRIYIIVNKSIHNMNIVAQSGEVIGNITGIDSIELLTGEAVIINAFSAKFLPDIEHWTASKITDGYFPYPQT